MAAFVHWLAQPGRLTQVKAEHPAHVSKLLAKIKKDLDGCEVHPRHAAIAADLLAAYGVYLRFACERDVLTEGDAKASFDTIREWLTELVRDQVDAQRESNPAHRFLALLLAGLGSKRFHLIDANSDNAPEPYAEACGWHKDWLYQGNDLGQSLDWKIPANSRRIGFLDLAAGLVYIDPELAKIVARSMARNPGDAFESVGNFGRDMADAGLIQTAQENGKTRYTIHKRIRNAGKQRYFVMDMTSLFGEEIKVESKADEESTPY